MDISSFLGGNYLTQLDLPATGLQLVTIRDVRQELVGTDQKIVIYFAEHPKGLGCNKTNLRAIAQAFGTDPQPWIGRQIELYRDQTQFQGRTVPCVRVRLPHVAAAPQPVAPAPPVQPVAALQPQYPQQPAADPWRGQQPVAPPQQQNSPPAQS